MHFTFTQPQYLWILLAVPIIIITHFITLKKSRSTAIKIANFEALERVSKGEFLGTPYKGNFRNKNILLLLLRMITYCLLILSISGATIWYVGQSTSFDFILAIDSSSSMMANDFQPSRLEAAKESALEFIEIVPARTKIGIVSFSGVSSIDLRPTDNREEIINKTKAISISDVGGTNIGDAIITSTTLLDKTEDDKSNVIILLTDGRSNVGTSVNDALKYANENQVIIHTIGVATAEGGSFLGEDIVSKIDDESLTNIANTTGGKFYVAKDKAKLSDAFNEIASITERTLSLDMSWMLLVAGLILLSIEWVLMNTRYRTIP